MSDSAAGFDVIIDTPGAKENLAGVSSGLRDVGAAAVNAAGPIDRVTQATTAMAKSSAEAKGVLEQMTNAQRAAVQAGMSVDELMARATGTTKAYTASLRDRGAAENDAIERSRKMAQAHADALAIDEAATRKMALAQIQAIAMNDAMSASQVTSVAGLGRVRQGLVTLVAQMSGTLPVVDRLGASMLSGFGVSTVSMVGVLGAIAAIGYAYEKLTGQSREAAKAHDELIKSAEKWAEIKAAGAAGERILQLEAETQKLHALNEEYIRQQQILATAPHATPAGAGLSVQMGAIGAADTATELAKANKTVQALTDEALKEQDDDLRRRADANARAVEDQLKFNQDDARARAQALEMLRNYQTEYALLSKLPDSAANRVALGDITQQMTGLQSALHPQTLVAEQTAIDKLGESVANYVAEAQLLGKDRSIEARDLSFQKSVDDIEAALYRMLQAHHKTQAEYDADSATLEAFRMQVQGATQDYKDNADAQASQKAAEKVTVAQEHQAEAWAATTLRMHEQNEAMKIENDALQQGEATRETYLIQKKYEYDLMVALTAATFVEMATRENEARQARDLALAHLGIVNAQKEAEKAGKSLETQNERLAASFEKDLLGAIERFSNGGLKSFTSFFQEVEKLSFQMVEQLNANLSKTGEGAMYGSDSDYASYLLKQKGTSALQVLGAGISGGMIGYQVGEQTANQTTGALGGAAAGAISGGASGGMWGAIAGGLAGAAGGLLGAADAHKKAAEALEKAAASVKLSLLQMNAAAGTGTALDSDKAQISAQADSLFNAIDAALPGLKNQVEREKEMTQVRADETAMIAKATAADIAAKTASLESSQARLLQAQGDKDGAAVIQQQISQAKELTDAITQFTANSAQVTALIAAQTAETQALAKAQAEAKLQSQEDLQVRALAATSTAYAVEQMRTEIANRRELAAATDDSTRADIAAVQALEAKAAADAHQKLIDDTNASLAVRAATATGNSALAATLQLQITQAKELYDAQQQGLDAATLANIAYVQSLEASALAAQQAQAAIDSNNNSIKEAAGVFGWSGQQTLTAEAQNYGFTGLTKEQVQGMYTPWAPGVELTPAQIATNHNIAQYLSDWNNATGAASALGGGSASNTASANVVVKDATQLSQTTGAQMADYLSTGVVLWREQVDYLSKINDRIGGYVGYGGAPSLSAPSYAAPAASGSVNVQVTFNAPVNLGGSALDPSSINALADMVTQRIDENLGGRKKRSLLHTNPERNFWGNP